jgi:hypothetical protein
MEAWMWGLLVASPKSPVDYGEEGKALKAIEKAIGKDKSFRTIGKVTPLLLDTSELLVKIRHNAFHADLI